jgi:methyl-accepting chemotaxis protein
MKDTLNQMSIKNKIIVNVVFPVLALLYMFFFIIQEKSAIESSLNAVSELTQLSGHISEVVHEWQKERGYTAGFLSSKGKKFSTELPQQRTAANEKMNQLSDYLKGFKASTFGEEFELALKKALEINQQRNDMRQRVSNHSVSKLEAIGYYTKVNGQFLDLIGFIAGLSPNSEVTKRVSAYYNFLLGKERAGIERAVLTGAFAEGKFSPASYTKFCNLVSAQDAYMKIFKNLASKPQLSIYNDTIDTNKIDAVNALRKIAYDVNLDNSKEFGVSPEKWFSTITAKIELLKKVDEGLAKDVNQLSGVLASKAQATITSMYILGLIIFSLTAILFVILSKAIINPINQSTDALKSISEGDGDLTQRLHQPSGKENETGRLARYFNNFANTIHQVIKEVQEVNVKLKESATNGNQLSQQMKDTAANLKNNANNVASSIEQMSTNLSGVSGSGENISSMMESIAASVSEMAATVKEMATQCTNSATQAKNANEKSTASSKVMNELKESAEKIGDVIVTISDIADKTDLLALNATIEAASAGEAGKGFAVVASEIKELSRQTQGATGEISSLVDGIRKSSEGAAQSSNEISKLITTLNSTVESLAAGVEEMSATAQEVDINVSTASNDVNAISTNIREVSEGATEISSNVQEVTRLAETTENAALKSKEAAEELNTYAQQVGEKVGRFKV